MSSRIIPNFPTPYERESFHYILVRFFNQTNGLNYKEKSILLHSSLPKLNQIPTGLDYICERLGYLIKPEEVIQNHSTFPYAQFFLPEARIKLFQNNFFSQNKHSLQFHWGNFTEVKNYRYCPECLRNQSGTIYPKVEWLLSGINVCPIHHCYLKEYPVVQNRKNHPEDLLIDPEQLDFETCYCHETDLENIAALAYKLFEFPLFSHNHREVAAKINLQLSHLGYKENRSLNLDKLYGDLYDSSSESIKELILQDYKIAQENLFSSNIGKITRSYYSADPFFSLILINFLFDDLEELFNTKSSFSKYNVETKVTLKAPEIYICQNPTCPDYYTNRSTVITSAGKVKDNKTKTRKVIRCERCKAVHIYIDDKFSYFYQRGPFWFKKLHDLIENRASRVKIGAYLNIAPSRVAKFSKVTDYTPFDSKINHCRDTLTDLFWVSRKDLKRIIRENYYSEYQYLNYNDKFWLDSYFKNRFD